MEHKHFQKISQSPDEIDDNNSDKNIDCNGAFDKPVNIVEKNCD